jgi:hypothetical protein
VSDPCELEVKETTDTVSSAGYFVPHTDTQTDNFSYVHIATGKGGYFFSRTENTVIIFHLISIVKYNNIQFPLQCARRKKYRFGYLRVAGRNNPYKFGALLHVDKISNYFVQYNNTIMYYYIISLKF